MARQTPSPAADMNGLPLPGAPRPVTFRGYTDVDEGPDIEATEGTVATIPQARRPSVYGGKAVPVVYTGSRDSRAGKSYAITVTVPDDPDIKPSDNEALITEGTSYTLLRDTPSFVPEAHAKWLTSHWYHHIERRQDA